MQLGKYQLVRKLATGGMAEVYLAKAAGPMGFEKTLVLKRILPHLAEDPAFVEMFLGEAKLAAQLEHPNIVQIFDFGEAEGSYFLAMELIDGPNLRKLVKRAAEAPLPPAICAKLVASAAEGLAYAHDFSDPATGEPLGLIHRDVSPDNILVSRQGAVKVVDFGIAKVAGQGHRTQTGMVKGKVAYMPPEQLQAKTLDLRVDVYALGVVLYELLTGKRPFDATTDASVMQAILFEPFIPATQRRPDLPAALQQVLDRALTKDRDKRYPDCRALQHDLERFVMSTGESVGAYQVARFVSQWMTEGLSGPVGVTPQSVAPQRGQTGPMLATAKSMVAPVESPMESTSPTKPMPGSMASGVREVAPRSAAERSTVEGLAISSPGGRATVQERSVSAAGQGRASSRSRSDRHAVPGLAVATEGSASEDWRRAQEAAVLATQPLPALQPGPAVVASAAKVDADDAVHTRSSELSVPVRKGSRTVVAVAVGGALLALGGAVVAFSSGSSGAVPLDVKPPPEQARIVETVAAPVVAAPPPAPVVAAAPASEVKPSGSGVAESAVAQAGTPAVPEEGKPVTVPAPVPPAAAEASAPNAPAPAPVAGPLTEKKPTAPARPRLAPRPAAVVAKGTLEFRIRPYAVVSLNGKVLGQTPLSGVEVPVGKHTLRLINKELGKDVTKTVEVKADQPNVFKLNLEAE